MGKVICLVLAASLLILSCSSSGGEEETTDSQGRSDVVGEISAADVASPEDLMAQDQIGDQLAEEVDEPDVVIPPDEQLVIAPVVVVAEVDPSVAGADDEVTVAVTLDVEAPGGPESVSLQVQTIDGSVVGFSGPTQGDGPTYAWTTTIDEGVLSGEILCAFFVSVVDSQGGAGQAQSLLDGDGKPLQLRIDLESPVVVGPETVKYNHAALGIPTGTEPDEGLFAFDFVMAEWNPPLDGGECGEGCPVVRLGAEKMGVVSRNSGLDDPSASEWGFSFSYEVNAEEWGEIETDEDVLIAWEDIVGNDSETVLPEPMRLDFVRPTAVDCSLTPEIANPASVMTYSVTVSEPLTEAPQVTTEAELQLFINAPEVSAGGLAYTWTQDAAGLPPMEFTVSALLTDTAGNESSGPVCQLGGVIATSGPSVKDVAITTQPEIMNAQDQVVTAVGDGGKLLVSLVVDSALELLPGSPMVMLAPAGPPVMLMPVGKESLGGISTQYTFEVTIEAAQHGAAEGTWPIKFLAEDTANNKLQIDALGEALVRVDFTPPMATCSLVPPPNDPYSIGAGLTLVVTPLEELAPSMVPELDESFTPALAVPWFAYEAGTSYQFSAIVDQTMAGSAFDLLVRMSDLVGNETVPGNTGCVEGVLSGTIAQ